MYKNCWELLNRLEDIEIGIRRIERMDRELQLGFSRGVLNVFPFHKLERFKTENADIQIQWEELENQGVIDKIFQRVSQLIYRFCREKMGIGIDTNIHKHDISMDRVIRENGKIVDNGIQGNRGGTGNHV